MTKRHQIELETIPFVVIAALFSSFLVWSSNRNFQQQFHLAVPIVVENNTQTVIAPTVNPILKIDTASQVSPDGIKELFMETTHNNDGTLTYVFTVTDGLNANKQQLYTTKVNGTETMSIPFNTWSPDNKYLFIKKNSNDVLVFKATGEPVTGDQTYFDVADLFKAKGKKDVLGEVTGWASPTLLIINTITQDNTKGYSYWLEIPSQAITQLASEF